MPREKYATTDTGVDLYWYSNEPVVETQWPAVIILHAGGYKAGDANVQNGTVGRDLAGAGFWALGTEYRLAPPHTPMNVAGGHPSPGQDTVTDDGYYPEQTADVQLAIRTARADVRCNGTVYLIGGSAGGSHTAYMAATGTPGDDMPDLVAILSCGVSNLADPNVWQYPDPGDETYPAGALANYLNIPDSQPDPPSGGDLTLAQAASPVTHIHPGMPPMFIMCSSKDALAIPTSTGFNINSYHKNGSIGPLESGVNGLIPKLILGGYTESTADVPVAGTFKKAIVSVSTFAHAFAYWSRPFDGVGNPTTGQVVIAWLQGGSPAPPPAVTSGFKLVLTGGPYTIAGDLGGGVLPETARDAVITDLEAGTLYNASLIHFTPAGDSEPAFTSFISDPSGDYLKGVWGLFGAGDVITPELQANLGIVGVNISADWAEVEASDGVYDFTALTDKIQNAKDSGFQHINAGITWSQTRTPGWLLTELEGDGQTLTLRDPGEGSTHCDELVVPIYWSPRWHAKRLALIEALGPILDNDPAINATMCSFLNHRTMDWNTFDAQELLTGCPADDCPGGIGPCDIYVDQPKQWNDAGWTKEKVLQVGRDIITACAQAFPHKPLKLPIGGMHDELAQFSRTAIAAVGTSIINMPSAEFLASDVGDDITGATVDNQQCIPNGTTIISFIDASNVQISRNTIGDCTKISLPNRDPDSRGDIAGNYSTIAFEILEWIAAQTFANRIYISRNTASANWGPPPVTQPGYGGENAIKYLIAQAVPLSGLQTVTSATQCVEDCSTPCRLFGNDPVCPPTTTLETVMQNALNAMLGYGPPTLPDEISFIEMWSADAKNSRFYDMTIAATIAMGGTPRTP